MGADSREMCLLVYAEAQTYEYVFSLIWLGNNDGGKILLVLVAKLHFHNINVLRHFNGQPHAVQLWGPMCCLHVKV